MSEIRGTQGILRAAAGLIALAALVSACATGAPRSETRRVNFQYAVGTMSNGQISQQLADLQARQTWVSRVAGTTSGFWPPCDFSSDPLDEPGIQLNGVPGQSGANLVLFDAAPTNVATGNASSCPSIGDFRIGIGGLNAVLQVGRSTNAGDVEIHIGADSFTLTGGYFEGSLSGYDSRNAHKRGIFSIFARGPSNKVLLVWGNYSGS